MPRRAAAELAALLVERRELEQVAPRLLEVEAHDLLELELAAALAVHALAPAGEPGVQRGADPLREAVVGRVADEDVVEAVDVGPAFLGGPDEPARLDAVDVRAQGDERRGTISSTGSIGKLRPTTDADSRTVSSSRGSMSRRPASRASIEAGTVTRSAKSVTATHPSPSRCRAPSSTNIATSCSTKSGLPSAAEEIRASTSAGSVPPSRFSTSRSTASPSRGSSRILCRVRAPGQSGWRSSSSGLAVPTTTIGAPDEASRDVREHVEQRGLGPVEILEHRDERPFGRERLEKLPHAPVQLVERERRLGEADGRCDPVDHGTVVDERRDLPARDLGRVVAVDPGRLARPSR